MGESQHIEWKESWHEKHLKWVCGFANAQGGTLYVGVDDNGNVKGINNAKKLLEDLPNQIRDVLGLMVSVNLQTKKELEYLEIVVEAYPFPISLRGKYYFRTGSTLQELKGAALTKFLLERQGKRWDAVPMPNISVAVLKTNTFDVFRTKAEKSNRLSQDDLKGTNTELLESLNLFSDNDKMLKRAAILLFHPNPEKYITGAYIKIGFFESDDDLKYQDEVKGNVLEQAEEALDLLKTKYDKATVSYEDGLREEKFTFPQEAVREALLNAIAHKDYSAGIPIQVSVYTDKIIFWNEGQLPENWTVDKLTQKHPSKPFNPDIANTLFRAGYIESWGRGTIKIINACKSHKIAPPIFANTPPDFEVTLINYTMSSLAEKGLKPAAIAIILYVQKNQSISNSIVQEICGVAKRTATRYLTDLEGKYLEKSGSTGAGTIYILNGDTMGS
jgi:ATP-dependent DNA helicase RecG